MGGDLLSIGECGATHYVLPLPDLHCLVVVTPERDPIWDRSEATSIGQLILHESTMHRWWGFSDIHLKKIPVKKNARRIQNSRLHRMQKFIDKYIQQDIESIGDRMQKFIEKYIQ